MHRLLGTDDDERYDQDIEALNTPKIVGKGKGKEAILTPDQWLEVTEGPIRRNLRSALRKDPVAEEPRWWKIWDVSAACKDIGGMECYGQSLILA